MIEIARVVEYVIDRKRSGGDAPCGMARGGNPRATRR
jgi:hypothetical protein